MAARCAVPVQLDSKAAVMQELCLGDLPPGMYSGAEASKVQTNAAVADAAAMANAAMADADGLMLLWLMLLLWLLLM